MSWLTTSSQGSQLPLYFVGGTLSFIAADIGGTTTQVWLPTSYSLVLAAVAPFCGYLQDLFGRRIITLAGGLLLCVGIIITGTAHSIAQAIAGMSLAGGGAAIGELTALAGYVHKPWGMVTMLTSQERPNWYLSTNAAFTWHW